MELRHLELNGGRVLEAQTTRLLLPPVSAGYADAQIDDYGPAPGRRYYPWQPGAALSLRARFSHGRDRLMGTAGFGFWNAPFGDPTVRFPALPQAAWFFYASPPSDLPFSEAGPGRGWFAATVDAGTSRALLTAPLAPAVLLLNQSQRLRTRLWPWIRKRLQINYAPIATSMTCWADYHLTWTPAGCTFTVDGETVLKTPYSPRGPLGIVCWLDNQYMVATPHGRFRWGTLVTDVQQWLEISELQMMASNQ
jgi:hypothetical protein